MHWVSYFAFANAASIMASDVQLPDFGTTAQQLAG